MAFINFNRIQDRGVFCLSLVFLLSPISVSAQPIQTFYDAADAFLQRYVENGLVDYATLKASTESLDMLTKEIASMDRTKLSATDDQAFLINAYNILVIKNVVAHYPIDSPLKIEGFFDRHEFEVSAQTYTLNALEKEELFKAYPDPRFHFVLVCAAIGCPMLISKAYRGDSLEAQLNEQTRLALTSERHVRVDNASGEVHITEIFSWYEGDFTGGGNSVLDFINRYRDAPIPAGFKVSYIAYDWTLNDLNGKP